MASSGHHGHIDLEFADDLTLLSHTQQQMQEKTTTISTDSASLGLIIHKGKSKIFKVTSEALEEVESFTYLGSIVEKLGGKDADVKVWIGEARAAFHQLKKVWESVELLMNTKIRIFNSMVKPVLLHGAETWRTNVTTMRRIQSFINTCLRLLREK